MTVPEDQAAFDDLMPGVQPTVVVQAHNYMYAAVPYTANGAAGDNSSSAIITPFETLGRDIWRMVGNSDGAVVGRLIALTPGSGIFSISQIAAVEADTTVVQVWRIYLAPNGLFDASALRPDRVGRPIGVAINAIADGGSARTLTLSSAPGAAERPRIDITDGIISDVAADGTQVYRGPFLSGNTFDAKGASHALITVVTRTGADATGVAMIVY